MCVHKTNRDIKLVLWQRKCVCGESIFFPQKKKKIPSGEVDPGSTPRPASIITVCQAAGGNLKHRTPEKHNICTGLSGFKDNHYTDRAYVLFSEVQWKDTSKAKLYLGSMIHDRSLIVITGGKIKQMYGYHRRLVRDFCEYRFEGGRWEEVRDSHNLWSYSCCVWAILCSFPFHCCSCKLTVHNERKGCKSERERGQRLKSTGCMGNMQSTKHEAALSNVPRNLIVSLTGLQSTTLIKLERKHVKHYCYDIWWNCSFSD